MKPLEGLDAFIVTFALAVNGLMRAIAPQKLALKSAGEASEIRM